MSRLRAVEHGRSVLVRRHQRDQRGDRPGRRGRPRGRRSSRAGSTTVRSRCVRARRSPTRLGAGPEWLLGILGLGAVAWAIARRRASGARTAMPAHAGQAGTAAVSAADGRPPLGRVLVVIPTYNERDNLEPIVGAGPRRRARRRRPRRRRQQPRRHRRARRRAGRRRRRTCTSCTAPGKEGLGAAYLAGFGWALERGYDVLVEMDADGSHQPEELPRLLAALDGADLVLGSRWVPGGSVVNWPRRRLLLSRGGNTYARLALGRAAPATSPAATAPSARETLHGLDLDDGRLAGLLLPGRPGLARRPARASASSRCRSPSSSASAATSKMSGGIVREALWRVTAWGISSRTERLRTRGG